MVETVFIASAEAKTTKTNKTYTMVTSGAGERFSVWEADHAALLRNYIGQNAEVEVDRSGQFLKITQVYGAGTGAPQAPAPAAPSTTTPTTPPRGGGRDFKKDPVGIVISVREKALGCAIASLDGYAGGDYVEAALGRAQVFELHLLRRLGGEIDLPKDVVLGEKASAAPAPPPPPPPPAPTPVVADDDIPF